MELRRLKEWPLLVNATTALVFLRFGQSLLADVSHPARFTFILARLLLIILAWLFAVVRDAESLAEKLGEPLRTLVLTLSVTGTEVMTLGLDPIDITMLSLTLVLSTMTFSNSRTNVLPGSVHLLLLFACLLPIFFSDDRGTGPDSLLSTETRVSSGRSSAIRFLVV